MKKSNYDKSIKKWRNAVKAFAQAVKDDESVYLDLINPCGFCKEYSPGSTDCRRCPLYPEFCTSAKCLGDSVFWQIVEAQREANYPKALELSKRMHAKIQEFKPAIIVQDKTVEAKPE